MSSVQVNILARSDFEEPGKDGKPVQMQRITYQMQDGRIGSVTIPKAFEGKPEEQKAIAESIKGLPKSAFETKEIKLGP